MKRYVVVGAAVLVLSGGLVATSAPDASSLGAAGVGDPSFRQAGNGGYDVAHYGLAIDYNPGTGVLEGVARIRATATQALSRFNLDLDGLDVRSVKVGGARPPGARPTASSRSPPTSAARAPDLPQVRYDGAPVQQPHGPGFIPTDDGALIPG